MTVILNPHQPSSSWTCTNLRHPEPAPTFVILNLHQPSSSWTCFRITHQRRLLSWNKFRMTSH